MTETLVIVGMADSDLARLPTVPGTTVRRVEPEHLEHELDEDATLAVLAEASRGPEIARRVHAVVPDATVMFLTDDAAVRDRMRAELTITPGIGRHTSCVLLDDAAGIVRDELERSRLRSRHRRTVAQLRSAVREFDGVEPETLSRYLSQLFDHAPIGILLTEPDGTIRVANPGSAELLGWQPRHAIGVSFPSMFAGSDADLAADLLTDCATTGACSGDTLARTGPDGAIQHLDVTVATVDPDHWDLGVFVLLRDESARVHALEVADDARAAAEAAAERYAHLARTLQETLLPPDLPEIVGVEIGARYHPAGDGSEVGGDFYDVFQAGEDEWVAVMGDVCGKGVGAARLTALTRYTLRATAVRSQSLEADLTDLNAALVRQYEEDLPRNENRFATATVIRFRRDGDGVTVHAGAGGHYPPLVVRAGGTVEELPCRGPLLGVFPDATFVTGETRLAAGDVLVLFTDGVTEARRGDEQFGEGRLRSHLARAAGSAASEVVRGLEAAVLDFQPGLPRDDTAILAISPAPLSSRESARRSG